MSRYKRNLVPGGTHFFTLVTQHRRPLFEQELGRRCLRAALREVRTRRPIDILAICLLPDHLHCVWQLPDGDADYSTRWRQIKI